MGEIADDLIDGFQCSGCGVCFEESHGFPVLCVGCRQEESRHLNRNRKPGQRKLKPELPQATAKEL